MIIVMAMLVAAASVASERPAMPDWLTGCWEQRSGERWTEECWSAPRGGLMIGYSRSGEGRVLTEWEVMQIALEETQAPAEAKLVFWAAPSGQGRTRFTWAPSSEPGVTFVNSANDYPQRIRYWRQGSDLLAEISMSDGSKAHRWRFVRFTSPRSPRAQ
jgi:hypothetical protein